MSTSKRTSLYSQTAVLTKSHISPRDQRRNCQTMLVLSLTTLRHSFVGAGALLSFIALQQPHQTALFTANDPDAFHLSFSRSDQA